MMIRSITLSLLLAALSSSAFAQGRVRIGEPHPDFLLPRIDDRKAVSLSDFRGKKVLLIHFASW